MQYVQMYSLLLESNNHCKATSHELELAFMLLLFFHILCLFFTELLLLGHIIKQKVAHPENGKISFN